MPEDLNEWLRAVRPHTAADADWDGADVLRHVHARLADRARPRALRQARRWSPAVLVAGAAAAVVVAAATAGSPTRTAPRAGAPELPGARPAAQLLSGFGGCDDLLAGLRAHAAAQVHSYGFATGPMYSLPGMAAHGMTTLGPAVGYASDASLAQSAAGDTASPTNVQVAGVDEPDIVKTVGGRVLTLTDGMLREVDEGGRNIIGSLDLTMYSGWQSAQLLAGAGHAIVILGDSGGSGVEGPSYYYSAATPSSGSTLVFVDLSGAPTVAGTLRISGAYVDARQIGSTVRLVARSTPQLTFPTPGRRRTAQQRRADDQDVISHAPLSAWLPRWTLTAGATTRSAAVPCGAVSHPTAYTGASLLTIYTLDLADPSSDPRPISVAADGDTVYATSTSLYVASNPQWFLADASPQRTELHRFDISGTGAPRYLGSGSLAGRLLSQYSLDEYDGSLRVASTTGNGDGSAGDSNRVDVFDAATLKLTGQVVGLGTNEQIFAVRFLGPTGYVVTYRQTDPLYTLDLSDPRHPHEAGALQLSGYSSYLHDAGGGRLIGVGEATRHGRATGRQVSLFDVTTASHPSLTSKVALPGTPGESGFDPHTFLYWSADGLIVVPVGGFDPNGSGRVLVLDLHGTALHKIGTIANPLSTSTTGSAGIQHSMIVDGQLWTISGSGVLISDPSTLQRVTWIPYAS